MHKIKNIKTSLVFFFFFFFMGTSLVFCCQAMGTLD